MTEISFARHRTDRYGVGGSRWTWNVDGYDRWSVGQEGTPGQVASEKAGTKELHEERRV